MSQLSRKRRYDNSLREKRAEQTRRAILDAVGAQLATSGTRELSVAAVAESARVSEPTVYRYFPNREALLLAFDDHVHEKMGVERAIPTTVDDGIAYVPALFDMLDELAPLAIAQFEVGAAKQWRKEARQRRRAEMAPMYAELADGLDPTEARMVDAMFRYVMSSLAWKTLREDEGFKGSESAEAVQWMLKIMWAEVKRMKARNRKKGLA